MKYVMLKCESEANSRHVQFVPIIFPNDLVHADAAKYAKHWLLREHGFGKVEAVSAGTYNPSSGVCSGESETLKIKSLGKIDADIIAGIDYSHGIVERKKP